MLWVEIQRGKVGMSKTYPPSASLVGATTACTIRAVEGAGNCGQNERGKSDLFIGDSWFASVSTAEEVGSLGHRFVGVVKTAHQNFPKQQLEEKMKRWPGGISIVMEGTSSNGTNLVAIGYKYNSHKVLSCVATKDAGTTSPGIPYKAKFADCYGNIVNRSVSRPAIISEYFRHSNVVDKHNQQRQFELQLEKCWLTQNCWFRLITTFIGITVVDCWKGFCYGIAGDSDANISLKHFVRRVAWDCLNNNCDSLTTNSNCVVLSPLKKRQRIASNAELPARAIEVTRDSATEAGISLLSSESPTTASANVVVGEASLCCTNCSSFS